MTVTPPLSEAPERCIDQARLDEATSDATEAFQRATRHLENTLWLINLVRSLARSRPITPPVSEEPDNLGELLNRLYVSEYKQRRLHGRLRELEADKESLRSRLSLSESRVATLEHQAAVVVSACAEQAFESGSHATVDVDTLFDLCGRIIEQHDPALLPVFNRDLLEAKQYAEAKLVTTFAENIPFSGSSEERENG